MNHLTCRLLLGHVLAIFIYATANANAEDTMTAESDASARTNLEPPYKIWPADQRLNLNLHIFGLSYHPDHEGVRRNKLDNGFNAGLGLGYQLRNDARHKVGLEAGFFNDSGSNWAKFAGISYQLKFGEHWRLGGDLLAIQSPTYNLGRGFVAPIPRVIYDFGVVQLNAIYLPKILPYNHFSAFGFFLTIPLIR